MSILSGINDVYIYYQVSRLQHTLPLAILLHTPHYLVFLIVAANHRHRVDSKAIYTLFCTEQLILIVATSLATPAAFTILLVKVSGAHLEQQ